jgi:diguanylate cyclase (GGDEF)-like protein|tara:strand:+ start:18411 stop:19613 length:1203 start_codon:yes stop_codon:yes gene_type:complete
LSSVITSADFQRLIEIGLAISAEKDIDSLLERILKEAKAVANADAGTLYLKNSDESLSFAIVLNDTLNIFQGGANGDPVALPDVPLLTESGEQNMTNIVSRATILGETLVVDDAYASDDFDFSGTRRSDEMTGYHSTSFLTIPLKTLSGKVMGVLQLLNARSQEGEVIPFSDQVRPLIEALSSQASVAMENRYLLDEQELLKKQLEDEVDIRTLELKKTLDELSRAHTVLKEITTIDPVTGIRNRQYFDEVFDQEWKRAQRQQYSLSMLLVDIDHFKKVNDTHGHLAGDECLAEVAGAIDMMLNRPSDVVARYGGEEFVVIMPYASSENAHHLAEHIREGVARRVFNADGNNIGVTISIGVCTVVPDEHGRPRDLISQADDALYRAKAKGRNRVCVYGSE